MGIFSLLGSVFTAGPVGAIVKMGASYLEHRGNIQKVTRKAEIDLKMAKATSAIKLAESQHTNNSKIDLAVVNQKGWMDEFIGIIAFAPLGMMLLAAPMLATFETPAYALGEVVLFGEELPMASQLYSDKIFAAYTKAFAMIKTLPREYWAFVGLAFIHFLGMRGFITQMFAHWSNKSLLGLGKTKK